MVNDARQPHQAYHNPYEHELKLVYQGALLVAQTPTLQEQGALVVLFRNERALQNAVASFQSRIPYTVHEFDPVQFGGFPAILLPTSINHKNTRTGEITPLTPWDSYYLLHEVKLARLPILHAPDTESLVSRATQRAKDIVENGISAFAISLN